MLLPIWRTVPRGRCRRGGIHRFVVVAVAGVSQGFRGRHWSAARSTGGTELGGYTGGQYSLRKVVHPEGIERSRQASSSGAREGSRTPTPSRTAHFECAASTIPPPGPARSLWHKTRLGAHHAHVVLPRGLMRGWLAPCGPLRTQMWASAAGKRRLRGIV